MLKLVEEHQISEVLSFLDLQGAVGTRIGAYLKCYRTKMDYIYFWVQKSDDEIMTVISKIDGDMTVCATENSDYDEIYEFLNVIGYKTLFMLSADFDKMCIIPDKIGYILEFAESKHLSINNDIISNADMKRAYELFCDNRSESIAELEYLPWLSDFTYKRNRNSARIMCIKKEEKQICFAMTSAETEKSALISGVVTDKLYRKQGFASLLVAKLADDLKQENKAVYIMTATDENRKFYENNGFVCIGRWGLSDRMI